MENSNITDSLPVRYGDFQIEYLNSIKLANKYKHNKKEIYLLVIKPIKNDGNKLIIGISGFYYRYKNKVSSYSVEGGGNVKFVYDCNSNSFVIEKVDLFGIWYILVFNFIIDSMF